MTRAGPHALLWRRLDQPGHERCELVARPDGWRLDGVAVFMEEGIPCRVDYQVDCDKRWRTREATIRAVADERPVELTIRADGAGRWWQDARECPEVEGALDVDLGFSPSTNLLPVRRLGLAVGAAAAVRTAWLPFPLLRLARLDQTYRRTGANSYRFEAPSLKFSAELEVDGDGMIRRYGDLWVVEPGFA